MDLSHQITEIALVHLEEQSDEFIQLLSLKKEVDSAMEKFQTLYNKIKNDRKEIPNAG